MATTEYISSFNSGQLSPLLIPRKDLPMYKSGCADLRNFYVLPQGGIERRQGSEYIGTAISADSKLIPFNFSSDESYIIELSSTDIKVYDGAGAIVENIVSPFDSTDIPNIKYVQSVDIIYLVCPAKPVQTLSRVAISPVEFVIEELLFDYPPFNDENTDTSSYVSIYSPTWLPETDYIADEKVNYLGIQYKALADVTSDPTFNAANWLEIASNTAAIDLDTVVTLNSNNGIFKETLENSYFRMSHQRANETIILEGNNKTKTNQTYQEVYIAGNTIKVNLSAFAGYARGGPPTFGCRIEKKTGLGGTWSTLYSFLNTTGQAPQQTIIGGGDDYIRVFIYGDTYPYTGGAFSIMETLGKRINFTSNSASIVTSVELNVSFSDWNINTTDTWTGSLELEKSTDGGGTWNAITQIIDTTGIAAENVTTASPFKEGANTLIRLNFRWASGTLVASMINTTFRAEGIFKILNYLDPNTVEATVVAKPISNYTTNRWSEGAFSEFRGYPSAIEFYSNRLVFSGTISNPSRIHMSFTDDYTNFLIGDRDADSIQITPNTNEPCTWLLSRGDVLYQGTRGSVVTISATPSGIISPSNATALESLEFGGSSIQAIKTNETTVYLERLNKKLREIFYSDEEKSLVSRDLTIMSNEIADGGFRELALQRTPDQIIYGLRADGKLAGLTYERSQNVFGWAIFDFKGTISSIAIRPSGEYDELWIVVDRANGRFIERLGAREFSDDLLDSWYVDSGVKEVLIPTQSSTSVTIGTSGDGYKITINLVGHGLTDGMNIRFSNVVGCEYLNDKVFTVSEATLNDFVLKSEDGSATINYLLISEEIPTTATVSGADISTMNGDYILEPELKNGKPEWILPANPIFPANIQWIDDDADGNYEWIISQFTGRKQNSADTIFPPASGWFDRYSLTPIPTLTVDYTGFSTTLSADFTQVSNTWTGLDHLNGETVQIQGDGGFAGTSVVSGGSITTDDWYNQTVIGLRYFSIMRPMYIEAAGFTSTNYNKNVKSAVIGFYRTVNGYSGNMLQNDDRTPEFDFDELEADWPNLDKSKYSMEPIKFRKYNDEIGQPIVPLTGTKKVNYLDTLSRIKSMFVIADAPMPMTVSSLTISLSVGGRK